MSSLGNAEEIAMRHVEDASRRRLDPERLVLRNQILEKRNVHTCNDISHEEGCQRPQKWSIAGAHTRISIQSIRTSIWGRCLRRLSPLQHCQLLQLGCESEP